MEAGAQGGGPSPGRRVVIVRTGRDGDSTPSEADMLAPPGWRSTTAKALDQVLLIGVILAAAVLAAVLGLTGAVAGWPPAVLLLLAAFLVASAALLVGLVRRLGGHRSGIVYRLVEADPAAVAAAARAHLEAAGHEVSEPPADEDDEDAPDALLEVDGGRLRLELWSTGTDMTWAHAAPYPMMGDRELDELLEALGDALDRARSPRTAQDPA